MLIVCAAGAAAALTGLTIRQTTDNRAAASGDLTNARLLARSGIESALQVIEENDAWRASFGAVRQWTNELDPGSISIRVSDDSDGDLSDDPSEPYTITSRGNIGSTAATLRVTVDPVPISTRQKILAADPLRYWPLDETSGFTATDITGGSNASFSNPGSLNALTGYDGLPAPLLDSVADFAYETHTADYLLDAGTIMCYVYCTNDVAGDQMIIAKMSRNGSPGDFSISLAGANLEINVTLTDSGSKAFVLRLGNLQPQTWTHIAVTFGRDLTGYVNGVQTDKVASNADWGTQDGDSPGNSANFQFGILWNSMMPRESLNGSIRDVAIFDDTLDATTISGFFDSEVAEFKINQNAWAWVVE